METLPVSSLLVGPMNLGLDYNISSYMDCQSALQISELPAPMII